MRIFCRDFVCDGLGSVKLMVEDLDDFWFIYNLIVFGDSVMVVILRKVLRERGNFKCVDFECVDFKCEDFDFD